MLPITTLNVEAELSYAYIHAVASRIGAACWQLSRHHDNSGIDAQVTSWGPFPPQSYFREVDVRIQLKATVAVPSVSGGYISYFVDGVDQYNDLREEGLAIPRILVVLFLAPDEADWLSHSPETLILKRCAYWVSLRKAPPTSNKSGQTVYIPETQHFSPSELRSLFARVAIRDFPTYVEP